MALSFPSTPTAGDLFTGSGRTWRWTGARWQTVPKPFNAQSTTFTGNGSQTAFSVANLTDNNPSNIWVVINGVTQEPGSDYSVDAPAGTVTLTSPLPALNKIVVTTLGLLPSPTSLSAEQLGALTATSTIDGGSY
jgi:hypothetical protein